jgi:nanoRNase/pAp phosphatase (c-di-AMP/oligoRNAs hydrolase)
VALRHLIARYAGIPVVIAHGGTVGRSENRAMLRVLRVKAVPSSRVDWRRHDLVCVVDAQPSQGYVSLPEGIRADVIFDHHPVREAPEGASFLEIDEKAGSTCTLLGEMILHNGIPIGQEVATALVYGMRAETLDLARETTRRDEEVYTGLYPFANKRLLSRILSEKVPRAYYGSFAIALTRARLHGGAVVSDLGPLPVPDMVPEMADFLLRLKEARWSCVFGSFQSRLYISVRCVDATMRADLVLRRALRGMGGCGGHGTMAGGQIPLHGMTAEEAEAAAGEFRRGFLAALRIRDREGEVLVRGDGPPR